MRKYCSVDESIEITGEMTDSKGLVYYTTGLIETVTVITEGTEYIASVAERLYKYVTIM